MSINKKSLLGSVVLRCASLIGTICAIAGIAVAQTQTNCTLVKCHVVDNTNGKTNGEDRILTLAINEDSCQKATTPYTGYFHLGTGSRGPTFYIACQGTPSGHPAPAPSGSSINFNED